MVESAKRDVIPFRRKPDKRRLNKRVVEALKAPPTAADGRPGRTFTYDSATPHLAIAVWSTGSKAWFWIGKFGKRAVRVRIGGFPEVTPEQAARLAAKKSHDAAAGIDPRKDKRQAREEMTLRELFDLYIDQYAKIHKKSWQEDEKTFHRYTSKWASRRLSEVTRNDVMTLHARIGKRNGKYAANRLLSLLSKMFSFAVDVGFDGTNPAKGIRKFREESRERFLNGDELRRLFAALEVEPKLFRDFFKVALLTGARRGNVMTMRWSDLDLDRGLWTVAGEQAKSGDPLRIHLTPAAIEILIARRELVEGEYVFPGRRETTPHLTDPSPAWRRVLARAKLEDLRIHDLRRTLGSWQAAAGVSLPIIGKSLGHKNASTTTIYARLNLDPVRVSVDAAATAMMEAIGENDEQEGGEADAD